MKPKRWKMWAALCRRNSLIAFGNGKQFQYPLFITRKEAVQWVNEDCGNPDAIQTFSRVEVRELPTKRRRK